MAMSARFFAGVAVGAMLSVTPALAQQTGAPPPAQGAPATPEAADSGTIGLEDIGDLQADLDAGFARLRAAG